jgi:hypothetical protein
MKQVKGLIAFVLAARHRWVLFHLGTSYTELTELSVILVNEIRREVEAMTQSFIFVSTCKSKEGQVEKSKYQTLTLCWVHSLYG